MRLRLFTIAVLMNALGALIQGSSLITQEQNLVALSHALSFDQLTLATLNATTGDNVIRANGTLTGSGWEVTLSGNYLGKPVALSYFGSNNFRSNTVEWIGAGTFNATPWNVTGSMIFTPDDQVIWSQNSRIGNPGESELPSPGFEIRGGIRVTFPPTRFSVTFTGEEQVRYLFAGPPPLTVDAPFNSDFRSDPFEPLPPPPDRPPFPLLPYIQDEDQEIFLPPLRFGDPDRRTSIRSTTSGSVELRPGFGFVNMEIQTSVTPIPEPATGVIATIGLVFVLTTVCWRHRAKRGRYHKHS